MNAEQTNRTNPPVTENEPVYVPRADVREDAEVAMGVVPGGRRAASEPGQGQPGEQQDNGGVLIFHDGLRPRLRPQIR